MIESRFSPNKATLPLAQQELRPVVLQDEKDSLSILVPSAGNAGDTVKVSFFGGIGFGRVGYPELTHDEVLRVALWMT